MATSPPRRPKRPPKDERQVSAIASLTSPGAMCRAARGDSTISRVMSSRAGRARGYPRKFKMLCVCMQSNGSQLFAERWFELLTTWRGPMGSTWLPLLIIISSGVGLYPKSKSQMRRAMPTSQNNHQADEFSSTSAIEKWASENYWGGFEKQAIIHGGLSVFIVSGSKGGGFPTSEISVFSRQGTCYRRILTRAVVDGICVIKSDEEGIRIFAPGHRLLLVIPWSGII